MRHVRPPPSFLFLSHLSLGLATSLSADVPWHTSYQTSSAAGGASTETVSAPCYLAMVGAFHFSYFPIF